MACSNIRWPLGDGASVHAIWFSFAVPVNWNQLTEPVPYGHSS
jgi:hypothetical protein